MSKTAVQETQYVGRFSLTDEAAQEVGPELDRLAEKHGAVTPRLVEQAARKADSILHDHFTWDDKAAGFLWRLREARALIRSVQIVVITPDEEEVVAPKYISVRRAEEDRVEEMPRGYVTVNEVLSDEDLRKQARADLFRRVYCYRDQFAQYEEDKPFVQDLDRHAKRLAKAGIEV